MIVNNSPVQSGPARNTITLVRIDIGALNGANMDGRSRSFIVTRVEKEREKCGLFPSVEPYQFTKIHANGVTMYSSEPSCLDRNCKFLVNIVLIRIYP